MSSSQANDSNSRRCAACKYLRRRCAEDCMLSPHFPASHPERFASVHRIFGASNVARMLQQLPIHERAQAADSIALEAHWRAEDPVYGSVGIINMLQQQIHMGQNELARTQAQIAMHVAHLSAAQPLPAQPAENRSMDSNRHDPLHSR